MSQNDAVRSAMVGISRFAVGDRVGQPRLDGFFSFKCDKCELFPQYFNSIIVSLPETGPDSGSARRIHHVDTGKGTTGSGCTAYEGLTPIMSYKSARLECRCNSSPSDVRRRRYRQQNLHMEPGNKENDGWF